MTLAEAIAEFRDDVDRFEAFWADGHRENSEMFPAEMAPGDWYDQFLAFVTTET